MTRFARNLLVTLFAVVGVFAVASPANAAPARPSAVRACSTTSHNGAVRGHVVAWSHSKPQRSCRAPYAGLVSPYQAATGSPRTGYSAWNIYYISRIQP
jgi:hypothetical protein